MKEVKVKFNNLWDEYGDGNAYDIVVFCMPKEKHINIREEVNILANCQAVMECYECDNEEELANAICEYKNVNDFNLSLANMVLENGECGLTSGRIAEFICKKYPEVTWEYLKCDCEIDIL